MPDDGKKKVVKIDVDVSKIESAENLDPAEDSIGGVTSPAPLEGEESTISGQNGDLGVIVAGPWDWREELTKAEDRHSMLHGKSRIDAICNDFLQSVRARKDLVSKAHINESSIAMPTLEDIDDMAGELAERAGFGESQGSDRVKAKMKIVTLLQNTINYSVYNEKDGRTYKKDDGVQ